MGSLLNHTPRCHHMGGDLIKSARSATLVHFSARIVPTCVADAGHASIGPICGPSIAATGVMCAGMNDYLWRAFPSGGQLEMYRNFFNKLYKMLAGSYSTNF